MNVQYAPFLVINKNDRVYTILLPMGAPYDEVNEVCLEFAQAVLDIKKANIEAEEKKKLQEEMSNAKAEAEIKEN